MSLFEHIDLNAPDVSARRSYAWKPRFGGLSLDGALGQRAPAIHAGPRAALVELRNRAARGYLGEFIRHIWPVLSPGIELRWMWMLDAMALFAQQVFAGQIDRGALLVPPGCGKSTVASRAAHPHRWLEEAPLRLFGCSHSLEPLGRELQADRLAVLESPQYQSLMRASRAWSPDRRKWQISAFWNSVRGFSAASSPKGGASTGQHAHLHVYDDVLRAQDRHRRAIREFVNDWLTDTMGSRYVEPGRPRWLLVMQRLHALDPYAVLCNSPGVVEMCLPMRCDEKRLGRLRLGTPPAWVALALDGQRDLRPLAERLRRAGFWLEGGELLWHDPRDPGELLCPERYPEAAVAKIEEKPHLWATQYMHQPVDTGSAIVPRSWFKRWDRLPPGRPDEIRIGWDCTFGSPATSGGAFAEQDWTVGQVWARWGVDVYLIEEVRLQGDFPDLLRAMLRLSARHPRARNCIEASASGPAAGSMLRRHGRTVDDVKAKGDTASRLGELAVFVEAGRVHLPSENARRPAWLHSAEPWGAWPLRGDHISIPADKRRAAVICEVAPPGDVAEGFMAEVEEVPDGRHDDRVDAATLALDGMTERLDRPVRRRAAAEHFVPPERPEMPDMRDIEF